jgi:hypothetical protein
MVQGLPAGFLQDLKWLLATAYQQHGLLLSISLWSHDMLAVRRNNPESHRARAIHMISDDRATNAYIGNALVPMLQALQQRMVPGGGRYLDAVLAFEVINEPEGMSRYWRLYKVRILVDTSCDATALTVTHRCCRASRLGFRFAVLHLVSLIAEVLLLGFARKAVTHCILRDKFTKSHWSCNPADSCTLAGQAVTHCV